MKFPKTVRRYNPKLRRHTIHRILVVKRKNPGSMTYGSKNRARRRGSARGMGNRGRYSKPAISKFKMTGKKSSKKVDIRYECTETKKQFVRKKGFRTKKLEFK